MSQEQTCPSLQWVDRLESKDQMAEAAGFPRRTHFYPGCFKLSKNQCRVFCHLLILFPVKLNKGFISLTDQQMR